MVESTEKSSVLAEEVKMKILETLMELSIDLIGISISDDMVKVRLRRLFRLVSSIKSDK